MFGCNAVPDLGRFLGPAHPTGCVPGARGAFIPVGLGVPSHPCRLAGSAGVRPGALDVRQSQPARRTNDAFRRIMDALAAQAAARAAKDRRNERDRERRKKRKAAKMAAAEEEKAMGGTEELPTLAWIRAEQERIKKQRQSLNSYEREGKAMFAKLRSLCAVPRRVRGLLPLRGPLSR